MRIPNTQIQGIPLFELNKELRHGELLYWHEPDVFVYQNQAYRWLCLGDTVQTVMDLSNPQRLVLPHQHAMALSLFFCPRPYQVLELGLGGGAMQRYFSQQYPQANMHSIEHSLAVIQSAHAYFQLNPNQVTQADAGHSIKQHEHIDLLLVDLFASQTHPPCLWQSAFHQACLNALSSQGILVYNLLPESPQQTAEWFDFLQQQTGNTPLCIDVPHYQNKVLICASFPLAIPEMARLAVFANDQDINLNYLTLPTSFSGAEHTTPARQPATGKSPGRH